MVVFAFFSITWRKLKLFFSRTALLYSAASGVIPVFRFGLPGAGKSIFIMALIVASRLSSEPEYVV